MSVIIENTLKIISGISYKSGYIDKAELYSRIGSHLFPHNQHLKEIYIMTMQRKNEEVISEIYDLTKNTDSKNGYLLKLRNEYEVKENQENAINTMKKYLQAV